MVERTRDGSPPGDKPDDDLDPFVPMQQQQQRGRLTAEDAAWDIEGTRARPSTGSE
ncbi:MAG: hypothetical protein WD800_05350 [Dehalococcoidia bacterium]